MALEAHTCAGSVDAFTWPRAPVRARPRVGPGGGYIVGVCGAGDEHLYVVASHTVDLSFRRLQVAGG